MHRVAIVIGVATAAIVCRYTFVKIKNPGIRLLIMVALVTLCGSSLIGTFAIDPAGDSRSLAIACLRLVGFPALWTAILWLRCEPNVSHTDVTTGE